MQVFCSLGDFLRLFHKISQFAGFLVIKHSTKLKITSTDFIHQHLKLHIENKKDFTLHEDNFRLSLFPDWLNSQSSLSYFISWQYSVLNNCFLSFILSSLMLQGSSHIS